MQTPVWCYTVPVASIEIEELGNDPAGAIAMVGTNGTITITDNGQPVAVLMPYPPSRLQELIASGRVRPHRRTIDEVPAPTSRKPLSPVLAENRNSERY